MPITYESLRAVWPKNGGQENCGMLSAVKRLNTSDFDALVVPDYQRGRVWTDDQCARFIGFIAEGGDPPPIYIQRWPVHTMKPDEILDGLQRLTAVARFVRGEVPMELPDGRRAFLRDLSENDQRLLLSTTGGPNLTFKYVLYETEAEVLEMYLRLNRGGTPHSDEEIDRVRAKLRAVRS